MLDLAIFAGEPIILIGLMEPSRMLIGIGPLFGEIGLARDEQDLTNLSIDVRKRFLIFFQFHLHPLPSAKRDG